MSQNKTLEVKILNKVFQVACPEGAQTHLEEAVAFLDQKMREIRSLGRVIGLERIAVMAALNITHELLSHRRQKDAYVQSVSEQIERLQNKIDEALMDTSVQDP